MVTEMEASADTAAILDALHATRASGEGPPGFGTRGG